jgi:hypothetical protein
MPGRDPHHVVKTIPLECGHKVLYNTPYPTVGELAWCGLCDYWKSVLNPWLENLQTRA